ncbi:MAG: hypothetical protein FJ026_17320 [Chloroflexi bacterium]|nr:hypothetical protein [Chloroflexota bacterium]
MIREQKLEIRLKTLAPLHIGGRDNPLTGMENAVARIRDRLVIPGPSLKGALRHQMERYLVDTYYDASNRRWPHEHLALQPCMAAAGNVSPEEEALIDAGKFRRTRREGARSGCAYPSDYGICPICYLLGAQGLTGFVRTPFLVADEQADALYSGRVDRAKGTIAHGTNRPYELVREGTVFIGTLTVLMSDDVRGWAFGHPRRLAGTQTPDRWLEPGQWSAERIIEEFVVQRLQGIGAIGGYRSKGFGQVEVQVKKD